MIISEEDLARCFDIVANVCQVYEERQLDRANIRSVDRLVEIASDLAGRPVEIHLLDESVHERDVKGFCVIRPERCDVVVLNDLNFCWHRFVLCKELFHVFLDCDEYRNMDLEKHLENMFALFKTEPDDTDRTIDVEVLAEMAAMEFLFPYTRRRACLDMGKSYEEMAEQFKVPLHLLHRYMSEVNMSVLGEFFANRDAGRSADDAIRSRAHRANGATPPT